MKSPPRQGPGTRSSRERESYLSAPLRWITQLFSRRELNSRVEEDFPDWQEFSKQKLDQTSEKGQSLIELPPHKVFVSSPLQWNFIFFLLVGASLAMAYAKPDWAAFFVYGAILVIFAVSMFYIVRDGIFFHLEGQRLEEDCEKINRNSTGPEVENESEGKKGLFRSLIKRKKTIFRSTLLQIHYQNVLRTFEQGSRRARVDQDSSITEIQTLLAQRGMKLVWTFIEVLPQLGLLGTLIGLGRMFLAFSINQQIPELNIIAGFGTALGTTILANLFVLILRPLYMRNERAMNEILSSLQLLMATFILPTQHYVLGRRDGLQPFAQAPTAQPYAENPNQVRLVRAMEDLNKTLGSRRIPRLGGRGENSDEALQLAQEVKATVQSLKEAGDPIQVNFPGQTVSKLTDAMQNLSRKMDKAFDRGESGGGSNRKIEHDLMQLRVLNHDTLVLMEQLSKQLQKVSDPSRPLLSQNKDLRSQTFSEEGGLGDSLADLPPERAKPGRGKGGAARQMRDRLFKGRR